MSTEDTKIPEKMDAFFDQRPDAYDYGVSVLSLHYLLPDRMGELYRPIHDALRPGGSYVEGDSATLR